MSKGRVDPQILKQAVTGVLHFSKKTRPRKFVERVEIHFGLKNFDPSRDRRLTGSTSLPHRSCLKYKCLILANEVHIDQAKELGLDYRSLDDLKKVNRDKKIVKKMGKDYDQILASHTIIRQVPRLLGPTLNKMGKFPVAMKPGDSLGDKVDTMAKTVKFQVKFKVGAPMCMSAAVGHVNMSQQEIEENITAAINYALTLMRSSWQNVKKIHIKSSMGKTFTIYQ